MTQGDLSRLAVAFALASSGCTIIFNTDELPGRDAVIVDAPADAPIDAEIVDADPSMFTLMRVTPTTVEEGVGAGDGRPVLFVLEATDLIDEATIDLAWLPADPGTPVMLTGAAAISGSTGRIGLAIAIPEIDSLHEGDNTRMLIIGVTVGSERRTLPVTLRGHDALALPATIDQALAATYAAQIYSSITTTAATTVTATSPLRLASYGPITIDHAITVNTSAGGCAGGAGAAAGGGSGISASCGPGSGMGGAGSTVAPGNPGGGGGFGEMGNGGGGGTPSGTPMLVPIIGTANRSGGGGGGGSALLAAGGAGGAGGGTIHVNARGAVRVGMNGRIIADGNGGVDLAGNGGAGGGGSGGAILVQAGGPIERTGGPAVWLMARGGGGVANNGGGAGRIRVDDPSGLTAAVGDPIQAPGPTFDTATPLIVRSPTLTLTARGNNECSSIEPQPTSPSDAACNASSDRRLPPGGASIEFTLTAGRNNLCAFWTAGAMVGGTRALPEAKNCVDVVYIAP